MTALKQVQLNHSRMNHVHFALAMKTLYRVAEAVDDRAQLAVVHAQITEHPGFKVSRSQPESRGIQDWQIFQAEGQEQKQR